MFCKTSVAVGGPSLENGSEKKILRGVAYLYGDTSDQQQTCMECDVIGPAGQRVCSVGKEIRKTRTLYFRNGPANKANG
jgi:hypothetical protein